MRAGSPCNTLTPKRLAKEARMEPGRIRSGGVTLAAILAGVVGVFNLLTGIAAVAEDDQTEA